MKIILLSLIIGFFTQNVLLTGDKEPIVIQLDSRLELFVDFYMIDTLIDTRLVLQKPRDEGSVLKFDKPWEGDFSGYCTIIKDEDTYRLYYRGRSPIVNDDILHETTCYAESKDGIHWVKPNLGLFEVNGTLDNNIVLANAGYINHNFSPLLDTKPGVDPNQRFKAL